MTQQTGRETPAAHQAQQARAARQKKLLALTAAAVVVVLAVVGVIYLVGKHDSDQKNNKALTATRNAGFINTLLATKPATYDAVGMGSATGTFKSLKAPALTKGGKPEVLYIGAEFCPFCGMERWALTAALSRFGTFTGLRPAVSSGTDDPANIPTMSYLKAKYTSKYLSFTSFETQDRNGKPLQTPDDAAAETFTKYNPGGGSIPFVDYGGKVATAGATFQGGSFMQNVPGAQIADKLSNPKSAQAQGILGAANVITAKLCGLTGGKPDTVCTSDGVVRADAQSSR